MDNPVDTVVYGPAHHGPDNTPCTGTAHDADTGRYIPCPHPDHTPTELDRLTAENAELRDAVARANGVAAVFQALARRYLH